MNDLLDVFRRPKSSDDRPDLTDAPAELGDTSGLAAVEPLEDERNRRMAGTMPDLPDRAFDHITPQV